MNTCYWCIGKPREAIKVAISYKNKMPICRECWLVNLKNPRLKFEPTWQENNE